MGAKLRRLLPNAKVIYMSATPVTRVDEMSYADRLGLWGPGTAFGGHYAFAEAMNKGGFATKEIVAKDMKALGMYLRRQLDYSGVQTQNIVHELTEDQEGIYNAAPRLWQTLRNNINTYMDYIQEMAKEAGEGATGSATALKRQLLQQFWSRNQNFYNAMLDSFKMSSVLPNIKERLDAGEKVVVQLVNTYEASQERQDARGVADDIPLSNRQYSPLEILYEYVENSFPIEEREIVYNTDTGENEVRVRKDANGKTVIDQDALARRNAMLSQLKEVNITAFAIDIFHQKMRDWGYTSAELTGRKKYYVRDATGKRIVVNNPEKGREAIKEKFLSDEIKGIVFSKLAGTGTNLQALTKGVPVNHYVIQSGWNIVDMVQGMGRTMRAKRAEDPRYWLATVDLPASMRMSGAVIEKLADLGAAVSGQAKSSMGSRLAGKELEDIDADSKGDQEKQNYLLSSYGQDALFNLWRWLVDAGPSPITTNREVEHMDDDGNVVVGFESLDFRQVLNITGMDAGVDKNGIVSREEMPEVRQFLNRLMNVETHYQRALGEAFLEQLDGVLAAAVADGSLDKGADVIDVDTAKVSREMVINSHEGVDSYLTEVEYTENLSRNTWDWITGVINHGQGYGGIAGRFNGFNINTRSGVLWAIFDGPTQVDEDGKTTSYVQRFNVRNTDFIQTSDFREGNYQNMSVEDAEVLWKEQDQERPMVEEDTITMVTGALLPVWDQVSPEIATPSDLNALGMTAEEFTASQKVKRLALDDGRMLQGRTIPNAYVPVLLNKFGLDAPEFGVQRAARRSMRSVDVLTRLLESNDEVTLQNGWTLKRRTRANVARIEITGENIPNNLDQRDGITSEHTPAAGFQYLIQSDAAGEAAFRELIREHPPRQLKSGNETTDIEVTDLEEQPTPDIPPEEPPDEGGTPPPPADTGTPPPTRQSRLRKRQVLLLSEVVRQEKVDCQDNSSSH